MLDQEEAYKVDRCLARYSPRAEANNGTMQYRKI